MDILVMTALTIREVYIYISFIQGVCGISIATDFRCGASDNPDDIEIGLDAIEFEVS